MTGTQSVHKALELLAAYTAHGPNLTAADFVEATGFNKSTVHRLLNDLVAAEFLARDADSSRFHLGPRAFGLVALAYREQKFPEVATPIIQRLANACGETVDVDVLDGDHNVIVAQARGNRTIQIQSQIGNRTPAHCTSTGKVLLAFADPAYLHTLLPPVLPALTPQTITDRTVLFAELDQIRKQEYAVNLEEIETGMVAVGVPIRDATKQVVAALSIGGPIYRVRPEALGGIVRLAREAAEDISKALGWIPGSAGPREDAGVLGHEHAT